MILLAACMVALFQAPAPDADEARVRGLIRDLGAPFLVERERATADLGKLGAAAEPHLVRALEAPDHRQRRASILLLLKLESRTALPRISRIYREDPDVTVREEAFAYLCGSGMEAEEQLINILEGPRTDHALRAVKALQEMGSQACAEKMARLYDEAEDPVLKKAAFECLQSIGEAAEPFLLDLLGSTDPSVRLGALRGLMRTGEKEVLDRIGALYVDETDGSVLNQAHSILQAAGAKAEPHFLAGLDSTEVPVRLKSLDGLAALESGRLLDEAGRLYLRDPSEEVRGKAAGMLLGLKTEAEDTFLKGLDSDIPGVRLRAVQSLGKLGSARPLERISKLYRESGDAEVHRAAFDYLKSQASAAEADLLQALGDRDKSIRREAMDALGKAKSERAIAPLVDFLADLDPEMKKAARDALVLIGGPAVKPIRDAVEAGRIPAREEEEFLFAHNQDQVERLLGALLTDEGVSGYYPGMFREIDAFGRDRAMPVLVRIVRDPAYAFRPGTPRAGAQQYELRMRELAILALGEFGDARGVEPLREAYETVAEVPNDDLAEELVVSLYKLGEKDPYRDFSGKVKARAGEAFGRKSGPEGCRALFALALVQNRVGDREAARATYLGLLKEVSDRKVDEGEVEVLSTTYYNLACLSALDGDGEKGVEWLTRAVKAGFRSRAWILQDRDLESLRELKSYRDLMAREDLFSPAEER